MPKVTSLGHVGLFCNDIGVMRDFYENTLGMTVTDYSNERQMVFLSSNPELEHHELFLTAGRNTDAEAKIIQQISFHVDSLEDVRQFHERFIADEVTIDSIVTHGNTASIYFRDPELNRLEIYYSLKDATGNPVSWPQPFRVALDIKQNDAQILKQIQDVTSKNNK